MSELVPYLVGVGEGVGVGVNFREDIIGENTGIARIS